MAKKVRWNDGDFESKTAEGRDKEKKEYSSKFKQTVDKQIKEAFERLEKKNGQTK